MPRPTGTQTRTFNYDPTTQRLTSETHPESGTKSYTYNTDGTLATRTDANVHQTTYTYDAYKRLTMKQYWYQVSGVWTEDTHQRLTLTYDTNSIAPSYSQNAWGHLTTAQWGLCNVQNGCNAGQIVPGTNTQMYSYTSAGQIAGKSLQVSLLNTTQGTVTINLAGTFGYDNEGHMTSIGYPQTYTLNAYGNPVANPTLSDTLSYDGMGRQYSLQSGNTQVVSSTQYGPSDELLQFNTQSSFETRTYNSLVQLTSVWQDGYYIYQYYYPAANNNGRTTGVSHLAGGLTENVNYSYDSLNRLSAASGSGVGTLIPAWSETYTYDGFGNLTDKTPSVGTPPSLYVAANAATNQLVGGSYDANGNTLTFIVGEASYGYSYDYENRLVSGSGDTFSYGPDNLRTYKIESNGSEFVYFYDPLGHRMGAYQIRSPNWAKNTYCVCGAATNLWFAGRNVNDLGGPPDRLGSAYALGYFPYGEEYSTATSDGDDFATYYRDADTGLDYAGHRYYSSILGRFLSADLSSSNALTDPGQWNKYVYVGGDPVNFNDPTGLYASSPGGGSGGGVIVAPCPAQYSYEQCIALGYGTGDDTCPVGQDFSGDPGGSPCYVPPEEQHTPLAPPECNVELLSQKIKPKGAKTPLNHTSVELQIESGGGIFTTNIDGVPIGGYLTAQFTFNGQGYYGQPQSVVWASGFSENECAAYTNIYEAAIAFPDTKYHYLLLTQNSNSLAYALLVTKSNALPWYVNLYESTNPLTPGWPWPLSW